MSDIDLERRVSKLEQMMQSLSQSVDRAMNKKDWRRTVGMFDADPLMQEIIEEGQRIREEDRRQSNK